MIIKRKYATYGQLKEDQDSYTTMIEAMVSSGLTKDEADERIIRAADILVCNTNIETGFPHGAFPIFMDKFEELDKTKPFDNGYTYRDVGSVLTFPSRKGNALMQILYFNNPEYPNRIVQVIAFEHDGDNIKPVEPWDVGTIILKPGTCY